MPAPYAAIHHSRDIALDHFIVLHNRKMDDDSSTESEITRVDDGGNGFSAVSDSSSFYGEC